VAIITYAVIAFGLSITGTFEQLAVLSNVAVLLMYLLCCAACWFLVQRDIRIETDEPGFGFPGMKVVPALAITAIIWILGQAAINESSIGSDTRAGLRLAGIVLAIASVLYFVRASTARPATSA
jgi:amino acid transporter